jgi:YjbE family integral membrane protein
MTIDSQFVLALLEIIWINILLSGDNAVVIALACRSLPKRQQKWGIILGTLPAIVLRIVFAIFVVYLMTVPFLKIVGALLLFWIAIKMLQGDEEDGGEDGHGSSNIWGAVRTIVIADAVMSLDNVIAIAAAARGNLPLLVIGLAISMPLIIFGSTLLLKLLTRFPLLVTAGGALLGWIAGEVLVGDPAIEPWILAHAHVLETLAPAAGAGFVVAAGMLLKRRARKRQLELVT